MKETIFTIPINDVFEPKSGCPICRMYNMLEHNAAEFTLGPAMMEPDIRIQTNHKGFCYLHLEKMISMKNRLSMALILETHIDEIINKQLKKHMSLGKKDTIEESCFICERIDRSMNEMLDTILNMYASDSDFRELYNSQEMFCIPHYQLLCKNANMKLRKNTKSQFLKDTYNIVKQYAEELKEDVHNFTRLFDYRTNQVKNTEKARESISASVKFLTSKTPFGDRE